MILSIRRFPDLILKQPTRLIERVDERNFARILPHQDKRRTLDPFRVVGQPARQTLNERRLAAAQLSVECDDIAGLQGSAEPLAECLRLLNRGGDDFEFSFGFSILDFGFWIRHNRLYFAAPRNADLRFMRNQMVTIGILLCRNPQACGMRNVECVMGLDDVPLRITH